MRSQIAGLLLLTLASGALAAPGPLLFVRDAWDQDALQYAADVGMNAAYLMPLGVDAIDLKDLDAAVKRAADLGLKSIIALPTVPRGFNLASPESELHRGRVAALAAALVPRYRDNPNVVAWATGDDLENGIEFTAQDLRVFLQQRYPTMAALNHAWGTEYGGLVDVTETAALALDQKMPFGVGRASVDIADFRQDAFRRVMAMWARAIRAYDTSRPLMTGRVTLYRSFTAIPDDYAIVCPSMPPDVLDPDLVTHNVHAVDMARRAGKFQVIPYMQLPVDETSLQRGDLQRWVNAAVLHGASGVGFDDWSRIDEAPARRSLRAALESTVRDRALPLQLGLQTRPTIAFLYEPYASAFDSAGQGVYGFLAGFSPGEPNNPFWAFRLGTRFGQVDYLTLDELPRADLSGYGAIIAPMPLRLPLVAQAQLAEYVSGGGRFACDLGAGMYETGTWLALPPRMAELLGVTGLGSMEEVVKDLTVSRPADWFPSLVNGERTIGSHRLQPTDPFTITPAQRRPFHVVGPICYAALTNDARLAAALDSKFVDQQRVVSGVVTRRSGVGFSCFATHRLWADWVAADPVYAGFHADLCANRPRVEVVGSPFWPEGVSVTSTETGVALLSAGARPTAVSVICYDADHALYSDGLCTFSALARSPDGSRSGAVRVDAEVPANGLLEIERVPVRLQPYAGNCAARLTRLGASRMELQLGTEASLSDPREAAGGRGEAADVRLTLNDGAYPVLPGSAHRLVVTEGNGKVTLDAVVKATSAGELRFSVTAWNAVVSLTHAGP